MSTTNKTVQDRLADSIGKMLDRVDALAEDRRYSEANAGLELVHNMTGQLVQLEDHVIEFAIDQRRFEEAQDLRTSAPQSLWED